ncbi:fungal-specific transcription factor domain-containing protein [Stachybotrys elegans]|uniref:Fungal-specific transcription factor domain-containing protein n=1 Tax=Stachybotrys elegans TaxID=80388 RepID=A0A8K0SGP5_9HYPO|nr:fungal-specific transcription factor domain-containing protein [Stachybotrys elegans]
MEPLRNLPKRRLHRANAGDRKRTAQACDGCRRLKEKCEGGMPCRRCDRLGQRCEFSGRKSRPAEDNADLTDRVRYLERIVRHYAGNVSLDTETLKNLAEREIQQRPLLQSVAPATVSSRSSEFLSVESEHFCIKPLENNTAHYSGEFSHWNFSMRIKQWIEESVPNGGSDVRNTQYYRADELQSPSSVTNSVSFLPPRFVANFLVHTFFAHAEANYWYLEREWLTARLGRMYEDAASLSRRDVGALCVVFMVLAIGTQYAYLESPERRLGGCTRSQPPADAGHFSEDNIGVTFYQQACRLVPDIITLSSLESVQACLLIGVYTLPLDASGLSYIYLNLAVKLAIQNGMHRTYPGGALDASVLETRNRVWWTAYTIERRVGIFHGRPMSISAADVDVNLPVDNSRTWQSTTSTHTAHLVATIRLNQVLGKMSQEISILRKMHTKQEVSAGMDRLVKLQRELASWWESLPDDIFYCKQPTSKSSILRPGMQLKLEYCLVRIFIGRAFILPRADSSREGSRSASATASADSHNLAADAPSPSKSHARSILVADCIDASLGVVETCRLLRGSVGLARASYTEFSACRAALLVITSQCLQKKTEVFRRALRDGLSMLKAMSAGGNSARSETSLIEAFEQAIAKIDAAAAEGTPDSDYSRFKKWEQMWRDMASPETANDSLRDKSTSEVPPPPAGLTRSPETMLPRQAGSTYRANMPIFGIDGNFAAFPQTLEELSSFFSNNFNPSAESGNLGFMW